MAVDATGNLYVADSGNNRVLVYNTPFNAGSGEPGAGDTSADFVYGQAGSFTTRSSNLERRECDDARAIRRRWRSTAPATSI